MSLTTRGSRSKHGASRLEQLGRGNYITDGRRLFRVVAQFTGDERRRFASLEDCLTLEVKAYSPGELAAMNLRPVTGGRET